MERSKTESRGEEASTTFYAVMEGGKAATLTVMEGKSFSKIADMGFHMPRPYNRCDHITSYDCEYLGHVPCYSHSYYTREIPDTDQGIYELLEYELIRELGNA